MVTILVLLYCLYGLFDGIREGNYTHFKNMSNEKLNMPDEYLLFVLQRTTFLVVILILSYIITKGYYEIPLLSVLVTLTSSLLSFSYFHNGMYSTVRNNLNSRIYKKRWKDESYETTALISYSYKERLVMFILGISITFIYDIFTLFVS